MPPDASAQGSYQYLLNGEATQVTERWSRQQQADGRCLLSSNRCAPGIDIDVQALLLGGLVKQCDVMWRAADGFTVQAGYVLGGRRLSVSRRQERADVETLEFDLGSEDDALLSPLMRIYAGPVIARLLDAGGQGTVVVPAIGDPVDRDGLLRPAIGLRQARLLQDEVEISMAGNTVSCRLCEYTGDQYGPGTQFWLGEGGLLLRYEWRQSPQQLWQVNLQPD
jgi:hypothetical protein